MTPADGGGFSIGDGYVPGAIGRIVELHATVYRDLAGFGLAFEGKVARELTAFCESYDADRDGLWVACRDGRIEGSIAIDGSHASIDGAHLRWFVMSEALRGRGAGKALLSRALGFCDARGYARTYLWTFEGLSAARHLYQASGFRLVEQRRAATWGREVDEQLFERARPRDPSGC